MKDMLGRENVMSAGAALNLLLGSLSSKSPIEKKIKIKDALGMICSQDIISSEDLPSFARSTVDGYAVKAENTFGATEAIPSYMNLTEEIFMGDKVQML
jgi:molybdopterin molybdotransferase